jgi:transcriptional regulator of arginine metabolism
VPSPERRRAALARLLRAGNAGTQEELLAALRAAGFAATQATLSRDLARLGARRVSSPSGGSRYELPPDGAPAAPSGGLAPLVSEVACNGSLVVVRTHPGSAAAVARAVDLARLPDVLGTVAGDDTVFVAPARQGRARAVAARVRALFGA